MCVFSQNSLPFPLGVSLCLYVSLSLCLYVYVRLLFSFPHTPYTHPYSPFLYMLKKWKITCNVCRYQIHFAEKAHKVRLLKQNCSDCSSKLFDIDFHHSHIPTRLQTLGKGSKYSGCLYCDEILCATSSSVYGNARKKRSFKGRGRRGRGRGRKR